MSETDALTDTAGDETGVAGARQLVDSAPSRHAEALNRRHRAVHAEVLDGSLTALGTDLWPYALKYPEPAPDELLVCRPESTDAVAAVLTYAQQNRLTVLTVGGGSNVVGALDAAADILLSTERLSGVTRLDRESQVVTVGAGTNAAQLEDELGLENLTLGIYPQSLRISTVGGWVSTRATGTYSAKYGGMERAVVGLTAVRPDGTILRIPPRVRPGGGLDAIGLLLGTEGSFAVVTEVSLAVHRRVDERRVAAAFTTFAAGLAAQRELIQRELPVGLLRLYNERESDVILPDDLAGQGTVLLSATVTGEGELLDAAVRAVEQRLTAAGGVALPPTAADSWFDHRYSAETLMQTRNEPALKFFDTIEVSVPWSSAAAAAEELERVMPGLCTVFHMHSSHVYLTGTCLYMILYIDGTDQAELRQRWEACWTTAIDTARRHGGTFGHHHGVGALRAGYYATTADAVLHTALKEGLDPATTLRARSLEAATVLTRIPEEM